MILTMTKPSPGASDHVVVHLRLIGQMEAWTLTRESVLPPGRKTRALLAVVALSSPRPVLRSLRVPVLALGGTLDLQVPARENLAAIDSALSAAKNPDYATVTLPNLNHLFQTARTGLPNEYPALQETFAPAALDAMTDWIVKRFGRR